MGIKVAEILAQVGAAMLVKCLTQTALARILIHLLRAWSKTTITNLDDKVTETIAEALDVPVEQLEPKK